MTKTILLARPHPLLVDEMKPWLEKLGYIVKKAEKSADLSELAGKSAGAVVSLAVASPIGLTTEEVLQHLLQRSSALPILFAALRTFEQAKLEMERLSIELGIPASLISIGAASTSAVQPVPGTPAFLYVSKEDLADPKRRERAGTTLSRFFR